MSRSGVRSHAAGPGGGLSPAEHNPCRVMAGLVPLLSGLVGWTGCKALVQADYRPIRRIGTRIAVGPHLPSLSSPFVTPDLIRLWTPPASMDAPGGARVFLDGRVSAVWCCRLSGLCLRPVCCRGPVWHTRTGSKSGPRALRHPGSSWFSRSRLIDRLSLPVPGLARTADGGPLCAALRRCSARAPGSSVVWWSSPRRCARCGWPARRRPASSASWPACRPATGRAPRRRARRS